MPEPSQDYFRLLLMPLRQEQDVVICRNRARVIARLLGLTDPEQVRIATAVSEIARNAFRYAREGRAEFALITRREGAGERVVEKLEVLIEDKGPGIDDLPAILAGGYRSSTGLGMGIIGAHRLVDSVDIKTSAAGT